MMQIFTKEDKCRIKARMAGNSAYLKRIESDTADVRRKLYIQTTGIGTWYHYFTCPICGTRLTFDYDNNDCFVCPNCKQIQSGEPYLGAWWEEVLCKTTVAAYKLALAYVGTGETSYFNKAKEILLGYAENYKNYEVHGGIPYNKPGRFLSQVLSDCEPICDLSMTYALLKDELDESERKKIELELLVPASKHQLEHLTPQLHNHEVAICTSIAAVALATNDEALLNIALNEKYGLKYQLDNALLDDNLWFEGSIGYHQYALLWFMRYETMAKNTEYSLLKDSHYREKIKSAALFFENLHIGQGYAARLNDGSDSLCSSARVYEYLYSCFPTYEFLSLLVSCYSDIKEREYSLDALVFGADIIPSIITQLSKRSYLSEKGSNLAMLRGSDDRYLCFKATPFSGEHDHYDRLSVSFDAFNMNLSTDFGTASGYGSPYHYSYFKNTASHNTVVINGENMAPCNSIVNCYRVNSEDDIYLDATTLPPDEYVMPDTFTIKQWNDEAYRGVSMRRVISWHDKYFIDVFSVKSDNELKKEWTWHVNAKPILPGHAQKIDCVSDKGAQSYFKNAYTIAGEGVVKFEYSSDDLKMDIHALADGLDFIFAEGPGNPTNTTVAYLLERTNKKCPIYVNVIEAYKGNSVIDSVDIKTENKKVYVTVSEKGGRIRRTTVDL